MVKVGGEIKVNTGQNAAQQKEEDGEDGEEDEKEDENANGDAPEKVNNIIDAFRLNQMPPYSGKTDFAQSIGGKHGVRLV